MKIQKRKVNSQMHTKALKISGKWYTRKQAVRLARQGKIDGVTVVRGGGDEYHLRSLPRATNIYDMDTVVV